MGRALDVAPHFPFVLLPYGSDFYLPVSVNATFPLGFSLIDRCSYLSLYIIWETLSLAFIRLSRIWTGHLPTLHWWKEHGDAVRTLCWTFVILFDMRERCVWRSPCHVSSHLGWCSRPLCFRFSHCHFLTPLLVSCNLFRLTCFRHCVCDDSLALQLIVSHLPLVGCSPPSRRAGFSFFWSLSAFASFLGDYYLVLRMYVENHTSPLVLRRRHWRDYCPISLAYYTRSNLSLLRNSTWCQCDAFPEIMVLALTSTIFSWILGMVTEQRKARATTMQHKEMLVLHTWVLLCACHVYVWHYGVSRLGCVSLGWLMASCMCPYLPPCVSITAWVAWLGPW